MWYEVWLSFFNSRSPGTGVKLHSAEANSFYTDTEINTAINTRTDTNTNNGSDAHTYTYADANTRTYTNTDTPAPVDRRS